MRVTDHFAQRRSALKQLAGCALGAGWYASTAAQPPSPGARVVRVVAASDLKFVLAQLLNVFHKSSDISVDVSYGSSGNFAGQIRQGLPADLFMSADENWVYRLADAGFTRRLPSAAGDAGALSGPPDRGVMYGLGRIALYAPLGSSLRLDAALAGLRAGWSSVRKFAIANPEHAPYGLAAQQALTSLGMWPLVQPKLVLGENIAQATQFVATGAAQAGITALSLALAPEVARLGSHLLLPAHLHQPLRQRMVLLRAASPQAQALYAYQQSDGARALFARYGFSQE